MEGTERTVIFSPLACHDLLAADRGGTSDPYVVVAPTVFSDPHHDWNKKFILKTTVRKKTVNPTWEWDDLTFSHVWDDDEDFVIEVFDWNRLSKNELIGTCHVKLNDEDLLSQGFPAKGVGVVITRSLGEGKGTIDLQITPNWDALAVGQLSWPSHSLPVHGGVGVSFRLPPSLVLDPKSSGRGFKTFWTADEHNYDKYLQCTISASDPEDDTKKAKESAIEGWKKIPSCFSVLDFPQTLTGEEGETKIADADALWVTTHYDYSQLRNLVPRKSYAECTTKYVFGVNGKLAKLLLSTMCTKTEVEATLAHHHKQMERVWAYVLQSMTIGDVPDQ